MQRLAFILGQKRAQFDLALIAAQRQIVGIRTLTGVKRKAHPMRTGLPVLPFATRPVADQRDQVVRQAEHFQYLAVLVTALPRRPNCSKRAKCEGQQDPKHGSAEICQHGQREQSGGHRDEPDQAALAKEPQYSPYGPIEKLNEPLPFPGHSRGDILHLRNHAFRRADDDLSHAAPGYMGLTLGAAKNSLFSQWMPHLKAPTLKPILGLGLRWVLDYVRLPKITFTETAP